LCNFHFSKEFTALSSSYFSSSTGFSTFSFGFFYLACFQYKAIELLADFPLSSKTPFFPILYFLINQIFHSYL